MSDRKKYARTSEKYSLVIGSRVYCTGGYRSLKKLYDACTYLEEQIPPAHRVPIYIANGVYGVDQSTDEFI